VRIYRGGRAYGFDDPEARALMAGDCVVEIVNMGRRTAG
jgi:hypothetical protein